MRHLSFRAAIALRQWISPDENPFLVRAMRTESRKFQPWISVVFPAVMVALVAGGSWMMWLRIVEESDEFSRQRGALPFSPMQIPAGLGGDPVGALAILTALITALWTVYAVRSRASSLLREEALRGTLDGLQMLPMREERWLWMMSLQPLLVALLIWCVGLPVYMLAVWMNIWTISDLIGLLFVWLWIGHAAPLWQPVMWKQNGKTPQRVNADTLRAALLLKTEASARGLSHAQSLELQRRAQRMIFEADAPASPNNNRVLDTTQTEAASIGDKKIGDKKKALDVKVVKNASPSKRDGRGWNWGRALFAFFVFRTVLSWSTAFGGGIFGSLYADIVSRLSDEVPSMMPWIVLTWPVVMAKVLLTPLWFFSFSLPPILIFAPLWIGFSRARNVLLASLVSASETFWTERRAREKRALTRAMQACAAIGVLGFAWRTLILNGELAPAFWSSVGFPDSGASLAALWTVFLIVGALLAWHASETLFARHDREQNATSQERVLEGNEPLSGMALPDTSGNARLRTQRLSKLRRVWRDGAIAAARVFLATIGVYFVCCWLGGVGGWSALWQQRLLTTSVIACAFVFVCWSVSVLLSAVPLETRSWLAWGRVLWFFWPPAEIGLRSLFNLFLEKPVFYFEQAPYTLLSPFVTLFTLFRDDLGVSSWLWKSGVAVQFVLAVTCFLWACRITLAQSVMPATAVRDSQSETQRRWIDRVLDVFLWLPRAVWKLFAGVIQFVSNFSARFNRAIESGNAIIIACGVALDNAVLTGELRRRVPKVNWCRHWVMAGLLALATFVLFGLYPLGTELLWKSQFVGWKNAFATYDWSDFASGLSVVTLLICGAISVLAVSDLGQSYDADRANGTLVFLFLTPMQDRDMLRGKLIASVAYALLIMTVALPFLLLATMIFLFIGDWGALGPILLGVLFVPSLLAFSSGLQLFFGVRSTKPGTGSGKALGVGIILEIVLWMLFGWFASLTSPLIETHETLVSGAFYIILYAAHFGVAKLSWHLALRSLRALRLGKVGTAGKVAS